MACNGALQNMQAASPLEAGPSANVLSANVLARAAADELSRAPPPQAAPARRYRGLLGPLLVIIGAWLFACANASAKVLYLHAAFNPPSLFLLRGFTVYAMNAALVLAGVGGAPRASVVGVMLLRCGTRRASALTLLRSLLGAGGIVLLNVSFGFFLTFADAFAIMLGLATLLTILGGRALLGAAETLGWRELVGGGATVGGILLVTQPPALFGAVDAAPPSAAGVAVAIVSAALLSGFTLLTRLLTRRDAPRAQRVSPAVLLSYYMVVLAAAVGATMLCARLAPGRTAG